MALASEGRVVEEGVHGRRGGTGMILAWFKGGTGSASRVVEGVGERGRGSGTRLRRWCRRTMGAKRDVRIEEGVPVGKIFVDEDAGKQKADEEEGAGDQEKVKDGSIIVVLATDAPTAPDTTPASC
jgi:D-aminopeptidase